MGTPARITKLNQSEKRTIGWAFISLFGQIYVNLCLMYANPMETVIWIMHKCCISILGYLYSFERNTFYEFVSCSYSPLHSTSINSPDEIFAVATESWMLEKSWNKLVIFNYCYFHTNIFAENQTKKDECCLINN